MFYEFPEKKFDQLKQPSKYLKQSQDEINQEACRFSLEE